MCVVVWAHSHPFARCDLVRVKLIEKVHELFQVCAKGVATVYGSIWLRYVIKSAKFTVNIQFR